MRQSLAQKQQQKNEFATKSKNNSIQEEIVVSSNTMQVDTGALLTGDSSEELRMQPRLIEKAENAKNGKMPRVTVDDLRPSQRESRGQLIDPKGDKDSLAPPRDSGMDFGQNAKRRQSKMMAPSPSHAKIDVGLKKKLLNEEAERTAKAKRDAEDERQREMEEFKRSGNGTASNVIMPQYERDVILECDREVKKPPES